MRSTQFGQIALDPVNAELYDKVNALMPDLPGHEIYCYPIIAHLYLMTESHNPTPYGFLPGIQRARSDPARRRYPAPPSRRPISSCSICGPGRSDRASTSRREYEPLGEEPAAEQYIYRRKDAAALDRPSDHRPS